MSKVFEKGLKKINEVIQNICALLLFIMMVIGIRDIGGRYLFNNPLIGTLEIFEILLPLIVVLGLGYVQEHDAHIKVEIILDRLSDKKRTFFKLFANGILLFISIMFLWGSSLLTLYFYSQKRIIGTINVPLYIPHLVVPFSFVILILVLIMQIVKIILKYSNRNR